MRIAHFLDLIFPPRCAGCGRATSGAEVAACAECLASIALATNLRCIECRARLPEGRKICHPSAPCILGYATAYDGPVKNLVLALKFHNLRAAAEPLGRILASFAETQREILPADPLILPVPLGSRRERTRGYNQAELIARAFAGGRVRTDVLRRVRHTPPQSELDAAARARNLSGAFCAERGAEGREVILIDDVVTSGATLAEAARALRNAGARKVYALTVARA